MYNHDLVLSQESGNSLIFYSSIELNTVPSKRLMCGMYFNLDIFVYLCLLVRYFDCLGLTMMGKINIADGVKELIL